MTILAAWIDETQQGTQRVPWRTIEDPQRQIGHDTLILRGRRITISTVLKPFMTPLLAACTDPYETALIYPGECEARMTIGAHTETDARDNHARLVDLFRHVQRARMQRLHVAYRRRRR